MSLNADVIIPVTTATDLTYLMAVVALRTCQASTSARIHAYLNNSPDSTLRRRLIAQCGMLGINMVYWDKPFSLSAIYNHGSDHTRGEYIVHATSDVIFFPGWLDNIIELWRENPEYWSLVNYSFDDENMPCVKHDTVPERRIWATHNPSAGLNVFRRDRLYRWDENITLWEIDTDILLYMERNGLKAGACFNARCDHLIGPIKSQVPGSAGVDATAYVRKKWNLPEPK